MIKTLCATAATLILTGCADGSDGFVALSPPPAPPATAAATTTSSDVAGDLPKVMAWSGDAPTLSAPFDLGTGTAAISWRCDAATSQAFAVDVVPDHSQQQGPDLSGSIERVRADVVGFSGTALFRPAEAGSYQLVVVNVLALHPCRVDIRQRGA